jgi:hypothetical protein
MRHEQLRRADLAGMTPEAIRQALVDGRCHDLLHGIVKPPRARGLVPSEVERAIAEGRLDEYVAEVNAEQVAVEAADQTPVGNADQGARGPRSTSERERLRHMTPAEVTVALLRGDLDDLLAGRDPQP